MEKTIIIMTGVIILSVVGLAAAESLSNGSRAKEPKFEKATFAGGCFWCMEKPFEQLDGVSAVVSGYSGGTTQNPNYKNYIHNFCNKI